MALLIKFDYTLPAPVAQLVDHSTTNHEIKGSNLATTIKWAEMQ
jgi:hypothetical protein